MRVAWSLSLLALIVSGCGAWDYENSPVTIQVTKGSSEKFSALDDGNPDQGGDTGLGDSGSSGNVNGNASCQAPANVTSPPKAPPLSSRFDCFAINIVSADMPLETFAYPTPGNYEFDRADTCQWPSENWQVIPVGHNEGDIGSENQRPARASYSFDVSNITIGEDRLVQIIGIKFSDDPSLTIDPPSCEELNLNSSSGSDSMTPQGPELVFDPDLANLYRIRAYEIARTPRADFISNRPINIEITDSYKLSSASRVNCFCQGAGEIEQKTPSFTDLSVGSYKYRGSNPIETSGLWVYSNPSTGLGNGQSNNTSLNTCLTGSSVPRLTDIGTEIDPSRESIRSARVYYQFRGEDSGSGKAVSSVIEYYKSASCENEIHSVFRIKSGTNTKFRGGTFGDLGVIKFLADTSTVELAIPTSDDGSARSDWESFCSYSSLDPIDAPADAIVSSSDQYRFFDVSSCLTVGELTDGRRHLVALEALGRLDILKVTHLNLLAASMSEWPDEEDANKKLVWFYDAQLSRALEYR